METVNALISWTHTLAAGLSLLFGTYVMFSRKGGLRHRRIGLWYFYAMVINNVTALVIVNAFGKWFFPHYLAIVCLVVLIPGLIAIRVRHKHWLKTHIISMVISYYLLVGGAINEAFLHVPALRPYMINNDPVIGIAHMISQLVFVAVLVYFLRKYRNPSRLSRKPISDSQPLEVAR